MPLRVSLVLNEDCEEGNGATGLLLRAGTNKNERRKENEFVTHIVFLLAPYQTVSCGWLGVDTYCNERSRVNNIESYNPCSV